MFQSRARLCQTLLQLQSCLTPQPSTSLVSPVGFTEAFDLSLNIFILYTVDVILKHYLCSVSPVATLQRWPRVRHFVQNTSYPILRVLVLATCECVHRAVRRTKLNHLPLQPCYNQEPVRGGDWNGPDGAAGLRRSKYSGVVEVSTVV